MGTINEKQYTISEILEMQLIPLSRQRLNILIRNGRIKAGANIQGYLISESEIKRFNETPRPMGRPKKTA
mgnify:CR=1 FL=1